MSSRAAEIPLRIRSRSGLSRARVILIAAAIPAGVVSPPTAHAGPASNASIVGTVRDARTGSPLGGALVALPALNRAAATDTGGWYALRAVPPGPQHLSVRLVGYASHTLDVLVPREGEVAINVAIEPRPMRLELVEVRAPVAVRGLETPDSAGFPDRETSIEAVRNHPLLSEPDAFEGLGGGDVVLNPETPSGVHIQGGASDQTSYLLDGFPVFNPYHAAGIASAWNPDALARLRLWSSQPVAGQPLSLAGTVEGVTRAPGATWQGQWSLSTTQARLTLDGPLGPRGAGVLLGVRSGLHDLVAPRDEASYLRGGTGDALAVFEAPVVGGRLRVLGYANGNEIGATAAPDSASRTRRHSFEWNSVTLGGAWGRASRDFDLRILGWSSRSDVVARWLPPGSVAALSSMRRDLGVLAAAEHRSRRMTSTWALRFDQTRTSYRVDPESSATASFRLRAVTPVATLGAGATRRLGGRTEAELGTALTISAGAAHPGGRARLSWRASTTVTLSARYARVHQFTQSLRNVESVVGAVFPVDAFVGIGASGVPLARGEQGSLAAELRPGSGIRLGLQAYARRSTGLVLVAPREEGPFATRGFVTGASTAQGVALDLAVQSKRYAILVNYGLERVRLKHADSSYVPEHAASHRLEGGVIVFPSASASVRLGVVAALGRRTTVAQGGLEWESCNLLDRGCEFIGSPRYEGEPLGGQALPAYLRIDLGLRKHWHVAPWGHDSLVAVFGAFTNVMGRKNLLTYARDPATGQLRGIELRPSAPLVVGIDGHF